MKYEVDRKQAMRLAKQKADDIAANYGLPRNHPVVLKHEIKEFLRYVSPVAP